MTNIIKKCQQSLSKILGQLLSKIVVDGILFGTPLAVILVLLRDFVWNLLTIIWRLINTNIPAYTLLILGALIILSLYLLKKYRKPSYFFFDHENVKWRANKRTGEINPNPYCIFHQVELVWDTHESFYCPIEFERENFPNKYTIANARIGAQNVATALVNKHLKNAVIQKTIL
jgi:hypothetical protein